ncbi:MAG: bifunctional hydroxymethylpyrimidine kinase/phosphomethylpyrimidine kinase [Thaumarchaeota archaeon]|jgi:hydroxymethylpyrimidine/phosphomethylpyrimidine kinase|nr:bifunctional hydroxymethylpyrimidine kinase/phosphomethylpyrimidine kinase [Candidatus Geocrenenecus arthurdayi]
MRIPRALTIAGSDSGGGAGIQADLKTFAALGVHGMSAITAITAQNTRTVTMIHDIPVEMVREQIRVVVEDIGVDAVKTGMLHTVEIISAVADEIGKINAPVVIDPVMISKSGARLLREEAVNTLIEKLIPLATVITPNAREAEVLAKIRIKDVDDQKKAAEEISSLGPKAVVIKGGHINGREAVDVLYYQGEFRIYVGERIDTKNTHGTGCTFASAIAAQLAKGYSIPEAVQTAKEFVTSAIRYSLPIGSGHGPVNPTGKVVKEAEKFRVLENLRNAVNVIEESDWVADFIPESQSNLVMAIENPESLDDIAGIPGRIVKVDSKARASSCPWFNSSKHVASAVLTIMRYYPNLMSAINIKYSEEVISAAKKLGYIVSSYDRREEPPEIKYAEGKTIPWGVKTALEKIGWRAPDLIYHLGDWGKEPMILVFGEDALRVLEKLEKIARILRNNK